MRKAAVVREAAVVRDAAVVRATAVVRNGFSSYAVVSDCRRTWS